MKIILFISLISLTTICCHSTDESNNRDDLVWVEKGKKISIKGCMEGNSAFMGETVQLEYFCRCFVPKLYQAVKSNPDADALAGAGDLTKYPPEAAAQLMNDFRECYARYQTNDTVTKIVFTPRMALSVRNQLKNELRGTEIEEQNDVEKFCDCLLDKIQKNITVSEYILTDFRSTPRFEKMVQECRRLTKKK